LESIFMKRTLSSVSTHCDSFCNPSLGPTSLICTSFGQRISLTSLECKRFQPCVRKKFTCSTLLNIVYLMFPFMIKVIKTSGILHHRFILYKHLFLKEHCLLSNDIFVFFLLTLQGLKNILLSFLD